MQKNKINNKLNEYIVNQISPTSTERKFISNIYNSIRPVLENNCFQIGSYPRFTSIRPLHDLDIIYVIGVWDRNLHDPRQILMDLQSKIIAEYKNPTNYEMSCSLQTHSITIVFLENDEVVFSVDIVPAYKYLENEFKQDTYKVPEILLIRHGSNRIEFYKSLKFSKREMNWISSDPRGYIEIAKMTNEFNNDFRKTVKFIKAWKNSCKEKNDGFKLKSFHMELVLTDYFQANRDSTIFDGIFYFFTKLKNFIDCPKIRDRANSQRYIDEYLRDLTEEQKVILLQARDCFLIKLENFSEEDSVEILIDGCFYERKGKEEEFLFDYDIPTLVENQSSFEIFGEVQERAGGFRKKRLNKSGVISVDRKIKFRVEESPQNIDLFKWKVKNDDSCLEPRGEISDNCTRCDPESTKYIGDHYVECYAIRNNVCVAKSRQNVTLKSFGSS